MVAFVFTEVWEVVIHRGCEGLPLEIHHGIFLFTSDIIAEPCKSPDA